MHCLLCAFVCSVLHVTLSVYAVYDPQPREILLPPDVSNFMYCCMLLSVRFAYCLCCLCWAAISCYHCSTAQLFAWLFIRWSHLTNKAIT